MYSWWRHQMEAFSALLALCAGNSPGPVNSPHKGQWRRALMFSLICVWINGWVNNREAGDLRRYRAHSDVTVMLCRDRRLSLGKSLWQSLWRRQLPQLCHDFVTIWQPRGADGYCVAVTTTLLFLPSGAHLGGPWPPRWAPEGREVSH